MTKLLDIGILPMVQLPRAVVKLLQEMSSNFDLQESYLLATYTRQTDGDDRA